MPGRKLIHIQWKPPFYYGWVIVALVFMAEFASSGMGGHTVVLFFAPMGEALGWSLTQLVGALTAQGIAVLATAPVIGYLLDKLGARWVMLAGAIITGVGLVFIMGVRETWHFWGLYALVGGIGMSAMSRLSGPVVISKWFIRRRGRAMAVATSSQMIGGMVMAPIVALMITSQGWRNAWLMLGIATLAIMIPTLFLFMRRQPEDMCLAPDGVEFSAGSDVTNLPDGELEASWTLREALRTRTIWILVIAMNLAGFMVWAINYHQVPYFTSQGMSTVGASYMFSLHLLFSVFSRFMWGFVVERVSVRVCLASLYVARALGTISLVVVPYPLNIIPFMLLSGFLGGAFGLIQPIAFANYYGRTFQGSIQGAISPMLSVSLILSPILIAVLFDMTGTFNLAFVMVSAMGLIAAALVLRAMPPTSRVAD